jgi:hypothetical protein
MCVSRSLLYVSRSLLYVSRSLLCVRRSLLCVRVQDVSHVCSHAQAMCVVCVCVCGVCVCAICVGVQCGECVRVSVVSVRVYGAGGRGSPR